MQPDALVNAYIDLNLLLIAGSLLWFAARRLLSRSPLGATFRPQLKLLNAVTLLLVFSPLLALFLAKLSFLHPPNLSDLLVSQYLRGNVGMSASRFENLMGLREDFVRTMSAQQAVWARMVTAGLLSGALFCIVQLVVSLLRLRQCLRQSFACKRIGRVHIRWSDQAPVAYSTRGIFNRYVVLPTSLLGYPKDLRLTLAHELQHFRQRDIECEFLLELLRPLLFWNPAFYFWRREVRLLREFACDQALVTRTGFDVREYCECLIRACTHAASDPVLFMRRSPAVALVERRETGRGSSVLARRLHAVTAPKPELSGTLPWLLVSGAMIAAVISTALLIQRPADWSHDRIMLSTIVNLERMASRAAAAPQTSTSYLSGSFTTSGQ